MVYTVCGNSLVYRPDMNLAVLNLHYHEIYSCGVNSNVYEFSRCEKQRYPDGSDAAHR